LIAEDKIYINNQRDKNAKEIKLKVKSFIIIFISPKLVETKTNKRDLKNLTFEGVFFISQSN